MALIFESHSFFISFLEFYLVLNISLDNSAMTKETTELTREQFLQEYNEWGAAHVGYPGTKQL